MTKVLLWFAKRLLPLRVRYPLNLWYINQLVPWRVRHSVDTDGTIGKKSLLKLLSSNPTIIEIGAHIGTDTYEFAYMFPKARIISFEPHPELFCKAFKYVSKFKNISLIPTALSDESGFAIFRQSSGESDGSGSLLKATDWNKIYPKIYFRESDQVVVPVSTLDNYLEKTSISDIDLIWIDVQGAELKVFLGAVRALENTKFVYCEVAETPEYEGAATYIQIKEFLSGYGMRPIKEFLPAAWHGGGNVLFGR